MTDPLRTDGERLAKRVAALQGCSRSEAERLIENGHVQVAGEAVTNPARRVQNETISVHPPTLPTAAQTVSVLWHKPAGVALSDGQAMTGLVTPTAELNPWHLKHLRCLSPLPAEATGLTLFVQDARLQARLRDAVATAEHEWLLDLTGSVTPDLLTLLRARGDLLTAHRTAPPLKLSIGSQNSLQTRLRLALKLCLPERIATWLQHSAGAIQLQRLHRNRIGRLALGNLPPGGWRMLAPQERV